MKKKLCLLLAAVILALSLGACGGAAANSVEKRIISCDWQDVCTGDKWSFYDNGMASLEGFYKSGAGNWEIDEDMLMVTLEGKRGVTSYQGLEVYYIKEIDGVSVLESKDGTEIYLPVDDKYDTAYQKVTYVLAEQAVRFDYDAYMSAKNTDQEVAQYDNHWVKYTGYVKELYEPLNYCELDHYALCNTSCVDVFFSEEDMQKFSRGQEITIVGRLNAGMFRPEISPAFVVYVHESN